MRYLAIIVVAGCAPDITSGAYQCGDEASCPPGLACNGPDNLCVAPVAAMPFSCAPGESHEPDNDIAHGFQLKPESCGFSTAIHGCLAQNDSQDWLALVTPTGCSSVEISTRTIAPIAFEPVAVSLADATGNILATDTTCTDASPSSTNGVATNCMTMTVAPGTMYGIRIAPAGGGDCDGDCAFNRYFVTVTVDVP
jgi:hypothetical protein